MSGLRIVFFIQNFSRGAGSERAVSLVANELNRRGYNISILSICGDNTSFYPINKGIKLFTLFNEKEVDNKKNFHKVLFKLIKFYSNYPTDIVIDVFAALSIYTILIKRICSLKNITWEHYNYSNVMGRNKIGRQFAINFSDAIVTLTNTDRLEYLKCNKRLSQSKIFSIFNPTPYPDVVCVKERKKIIIAVGRLVKLKGFDQLIDVWSKICVCYPDWKLQIVGAGEEYSNLKKQICEMEISNVELLGEIKEVDKFYQMASIYVSTSEREGLPMTMIEAQSFGLPIVSFDYKTGPRDIITEGEDGFIIAQTDDRNENMAKKLSELMENSSLLENMSLIAEKSSCRFHVDNIGDRWESVIQKMIEGKKE